MPITLAKIANNTSKVTLQISSEDGIDELNVVYYPARVTEKTFSQLQQFDTTTDETTIAAKFEGLNDVFSKLIKSWDLFLDEEQTVMYPLDPEKLAELPIIFRMQVIGAIMEDIRPETIAPQVKN